MKNRPGATDGTVILKNKLGFSRVAARQIKPASEVSLERIKSSRDDKNILSIS